MLYDQHADSYAKARKSDPRIAARIDAALGDARTVVNVGAGAGSYEPAGREVTAVEPSAEMIAQRPPGAAPAVRASAEALPFEDDSFDAAMAVLTVHHWPDRERRPGRDAARRPRPRRPRHLRPGSRCASSGSSATTSRRSSDCTPTGSRAPSLAAELPSASLEPIPIPRDCADLFFAALWARPELVFDPDVVRPMWVWQSLPEEDRRLGTRAARRRPRLGRLGGAQRAPAASESSRSTSAYD